MSDDIEQAREAISWIQLFSGQDIDSMTIVRLGGLTNLVFRVATQGHTYCLRIPGKGTEEYIDREVEEHNARVAADVGVSPSVLYFDQKTGIKVTDFLDGTETMTPSTFLAKPGAPTRAARALRQLHASGQAFRFRFELFSMIDDYLKVLDTLGADLPEGYQEVVDEAAVVRQALSAHPVELAPCHCDPLCENFLDDGQKMWIVDWEYSGMNDPLWDLGDLSVEAGFTQRHDQEMMETYFDGQAHDAQIGRMVIYKAMADLLWTLWGLIQHVNKNPVDDFWTYATGRFDRCKQLMANSEFSHHLKAVRDNL